jgi:hypothetical protein
MVLNILSIVVGAFLVLAALLDVFESVIVPRSVGRRLRISFYVWRGCWSAWPALGWIGHRDDAEKREDFLALFAPFMLVGLMLVWTVFVLLGYALILWGMRGGTVPPLRTLGEAAYFSGTSLFTLGFGDIAGHTAGPRIVSLIAALNGLALLSITTAYLFALFGSFQAREAFVVMVGARAGAPPSGVNLLAIAGHSETRGDLGGLMLDGQRWAAVVMESHLAYPVLAFFRSSHDYESWVGTLGTLLDAATLLMTTVQGEHAGQARLFYNLGRHATHDLSRYFRLGDPHESPGIERSEFEHACDRLVSAGYTLTDRDEAWKKFSALRSTYAGHLNALAHFFRIPPLQWIGDRSSVRHR